MSSENIVDEKKVVKRGDTWCVVHGPGSDEGKIIKCFHTQKEALAMHAAIMANKNQKSDIAQIRMVIERIVSLTDDELQNLEDMLDVE